MSKKVVGFVFGLVLIGNSLAFSQSKKEIETKRDTIRYCSGRIISIIETNEKGQYNGNTIHFYRNGIISEIEQYKHGLLDGKSVYFYETGDTSVTIEYKKGIQHGKAIAYYPRNKKMFSENYFGNKLLGECIYYDTSGTFFSGVFKHNIFKNGSDKIREVNCSNGIPDGDLKISDEEHCNLLFKCHYTNGLIEGKAIAYKSDGSVENASWYEKGKYIKEDDSLYHSNILAYSNYLHFDSTNSFLYYQRAMAYLRLGKKTDAVKDFDKVTKLEPKNYKAYYNRGVILADSLPLRALADFKKCNAIQPDFYPSHHNTGFVYFKQKEYKKAIEGFKKALIYKPEYLPSINYLGLVYEIMKDKKKSNYYFELAESIQSR